MRVTVVYEDTRLTLDVDAEEKIKSLKKTVKSKMVVETTEDKKVGKYLEMRFGGAPLHNDWILQDIGITSGSVIKCALKVIEKPKLDVYLVYSRKTIYLTEDIDPISMKVGELRSILSSKLGIPVSVFRLSYAPTVGENVSFVSSTSSSNRLNSSRKKNVQELYDRNTLDYYGIEIGSKVILDLWDGWNELILASIIGHEKIASQYFSWDRPVRHFQQRVVLYIASYYGHMGLATAMIKYGARGHEPVGMHPFRKWCFESEHPDTQKCPVHVACARGHLPVLRLFVKNSPLCFVIKDEQGRIPLQIVLRHRHRSCFEFLIARQWGRKTGKDFSFSMTLYCRIIQWCERAKARTLLMYGVGKSTFRGLPKKEGALVGTSVLVDGFSKKPANSVPYALVPKPEVPPADMMFAIAIAKRKMKSYRRRNSSKVFSRRESVVSIVSDEGYKERIKSSTTQGSSFSQISSTKCEKCSEESQRGKFNLQMALRNNGNLRSGKTKSQSQMFANSIIEERLVDCKEKSKSQSSFAKTKNDSPSNSSLPTLPSSFKNRQFARKDSRISFKPVDASDIVSATRFPFSSVGSTSLISLASQPPPAVKRPTPPVQPKSMDSGIPLPPKSLESHLKPFFYWSPYQSLQNPVETTLEKFESYRGVTPRKHAVQCLAVTSSFTEKPWLQQLRMAVSLTKRGVKKEVEAGVHSIAVSG